MISPEYEKGGIITLNCSTKLQDFPKSAKVRLKTVGSDVRVIVLPVKLTVVYILQKKVVVSVKYLVKSKKIGSAKYAWTLLYFKLNCMKLSLYRSKKSNSILFQM